MRLRDVTRLGWKTLEGRVGDGSLERGQPGDIQELLAQVRRLTILVLDMIEEGKEGKTMEDHDKRFLVGYASKLFRLWKTTANQAAAERARARAENADSGSIE